MVVAAHLGLGPFERREQFARLKKRIAEIADRPLVVLGDFNDFPGRGLAERSLCPPLDATPELPTYPSRLPLLPLDRIWISKPLELVTIATLQRRRARVGPPAAARELEAPGATLPIVRAAAA